MKKVILFFVVGLLLGCGPYERNFIMVGHNLSKEKYEFTYYVRYPEREWIKILCKYKKLEFEDKRLQLYFYDNYGATPKNRNDYFTRCFSDSFLIATYKYDPADSLESLEFTKRFEILHS